MKKTTKQEVPEVLTSYIDKKEEYQEKYKVKRETQTQARNRRQAIRELKEDREWN